MDSDALRAAYAERPARCNTRRPALGFMLRQALGLQVGGHSGNVGGVGPRQVRQGLVARLGVRGGVLEAVEDQAFDRSPRAPTTCP